MADNDDLETDVLHVCTAALARLNPPEEHVRAIIRIFRYLHERFGDDAKMRERQIEKEYLLAHEELVALLEKEAQIRSQIDSVTQSIANAEMIGEPAADSAKEE